MKKFVIYFIVIINVIFMSGCGKTKKLECTQSNDIMSTKTQTVFKNDKIKSMTVVYSYDISNYSSENKEELKKQDLCDTLDKSENDYKGKFLNCKQDYRNNSIVVIADIDVKKEVNSYEQLKKELEVAGAKCE